VIKKCPICGAPTKPLIHPEALRCLNPNCRHQPSVAQVYEEIKLAAGVVPSSRGDVLPEAIFETPRLRVFLTRLKPTDHNEARDVFVAFRTDEDRPMVCATAVVSPGTRVGNYVDWLEVTSECRRQGFGRELLQALERHYGTVISGAGSDDGAALLAAMEKERGEQEQSISGSSREI